MVTGLVTMLLFRPWPPRHWSHHDSPRKSTRPVCPEPSRPPPRAHGWRHSPPEGSGIEMKTTRRYAAGLAAVVTTAASLLAVTGLGAGVADASGIPAFVGPLHRIT